MVIVLNWLKNEQNAIGENFGGKEDVFGEIKEKKLSILRTMPWNIEIWWKTLAKTFTHWKSAMQVSFKIYKFGNWIMPRLCIHFCYTRDRVDLKWHSWIKIVFYIDGGSLFILRLEVLQFEYDVSSILGFYIVSYKKDHANPPHLLWNKKGCIILALSNFQVYIIQNLTA